MTTTFSPSSYNLGATLVSIGLLWWHGLVAAVIGSIILTVILVYVFQFYLQILVSEAVSSNPEASKKSLGRDKEVCKAA